MAKLYGLTTSDPVEAPMGIVSVSGSPIALPQGFTLPSGKTASIAGSLSVTGSTTLASLTVSGAATLSGSLTSTGFTISGQDTISSFRQGSFSATIAGFDGSPVSTTVWYTRIGNAVIFSIPAFSGTSNSTTMTVGSLPAEIAPLSTKVIPVIVRDNGVNSVGYVSIATNGLMTFAKDATGAVFTNSGTKGILAVSGSYVRD